MAKAKTCPFCGRELIPTKVKDKVHGGDLVLFYIHEAGECILSYFKVLPEEVEAWNRRDEKCD